MHILCDFGALGMYRYGDIGFLSDRGRISYIFLYYCNNYKDDHNICLTHPNDFIIAWVRDIDYISCQFVENRHDDILLWHVTSFSYTFPYKWRHMKNVDVIKNNDVRLKMGVKNKSSYRTVLCVWKTAYVSMFAGF